MRTNKCEKWAKKSRKWSRMAYNILFYSVLFFRSMLCYRHWRCRSLPFMLFTFVCFFRRSLSNDWSHFFAFSSYAIRCYCRCLTFIRGVCQLLCAEFLGRFSFGNPHLNAKWMDDLNEHVSKFSFSVILFFFGFRRSSSPLILFSASFAHSIYSFLHFKQSIFAMLFARTRFE